MVSSLSSSILFKYADSKSKASTGQSLQAAIARRSQKDANLATGA